MGGSVYFERSGGDLGAAAREFRVTRFARGRWVRFSVIFFLAFRRFMKYVIVLQGKRSLY